MKIELLKQFDSKTQKTEFLRKLEFVLIDNNLMDKSDLMKFRNNYAFDVIDLLNSYQKNRIRIYIYIILYKDVK